VKDVDGGKDEYWTSSNARDSRNTPDLDRQKESSRPGTAVLHQQKWASAVPPARICGTVPGAQKQERVHSACVGLRRVALGGRHIRYVCLLELTLKLHVPGSRSPTHHFETGPWWELEGGGCESNRGESAWAGKLQDCKVETGLDCLLVKPGVDKGHGGLQDFHL